MPKHPTDQTQREARSARLSPTFAPLRHHPVNSAEEPFGQIEHWALWQQFPVPDMTQVQPPIEFTAEEDEMFAQLFDYEAYISSGTTEEMLLVSVLPSDDEPTPSSTEVAPTHINQTAPQSETIQEPTDTLAAAQPITGHQQGSMTWAQHPTEVAPTQFNQTASPSATIQHATNTLAAAQPITEHQQGSMTWAYQPTEVTPTQINRTAPPSATIQHATNTLAAAQPITEHQQGWMTWLQYPPVTQSIWHPQASTAIPQAVQHEPHHISVPANGQVHAPPPPSTTAILQEKRHSPEYNLGEVNGIYGWRPPWHEYWLRNAHSSVV